MIMENLTPSGSLDTDKFTRALLIHRNQTDPVSGLSPAQVIFGRQLRDHLPLQPEKFQPRAEWRLEADQRERAFSKRHLLKHEQLSSTSKTLPNLKVGDCVAIQDKSNTGKAGKWTKTGVVTDSLGFQSYEIKVDGSNHLQTRNRCHLRKIIPYINEQMTHDRNSMLPTPAPQPALPTTSPTPPPAAPAPCTLPARNPPSTSPISPIPAAQPPIPKLRLTRQDKNSDSWIVCKDHKPPSIIPHAMTTVQALSVTYPVPGSRGEGFART